MEKGDIKTQETQKHEDCKRELNLSVGEHGIIIRSFDELVKFSKTIASSGLCPKNYHGKPNDVFTAIQMGFELGIPPMQSLQNIAVVNGTPSLWGDAIPGLVIGSGKEEWNKIEQVGDPLNANGKYPDNFGFKYISKRIGRKEPHSVTFTVRDARQAGLWGKSGTWSQYPERMLLYRARTFCCRDLYPDVLKGIHTVEEMRDVREVEYELVGDKESRTEKLAGTLSQSKGIPEKTEEESKEHDSGTDPEITETSSSSADSEIEQPPEDNQKKEQESLVSEKQTGAIYGRAKTDYKLDHKQALQFASDIVKCKLGSMKDLTKKEASRVIDKLHQPEEMQKYLKELSLKTEEKIDGEIPF